MTRKIFSSKDAAPSVLHGLKEADGVTAYPIIVDIHGNMRSQQGPSNLQMRIEYDDSINREKYIGYNDLGVSESASNWLLHYIQYDAQRRIISRKVSYDSWDNRASATYS